MTRIEVAAGALEDAERLLEHLVRHGAADAGHRVAAIFAALQLLAEHPRIGRPLDHGLRELLIGKGTRAYAALYRYVAAEDKVVVLALRAQAERGFGGP